MHSGNLDLRGLWVPIVTPFGPDGGIDEASLRQLGTRLLEDGAVGLVALGTTGEPATLAAAERRVVVEVCGASVQAVNRSLIVGAGTNSTDATIDEIKMLSAAANVDAALVVVPYYTRPTEAAVVEHFQIVAEASPVPVVVYNVPYRTGRALGADAILDLAAHPNIVGLKQAVGCLDRDTLEILRHRVNPSVDRGFAVLAGDDAFIAPSVLMGATGAIAAAANLCTSTFASMVEAAFANDVDRASALAEALLPIVDAGFAEPSPAVWKGAMHRLGELPSDTLRRPMTSASDISVSRLIRCVETLQSPAGKLLAEAE